MATQKHTPGPWEVRDSVDVYSGGRHVCDCSGADSVLHVGLENAANARLIAAAPDLLEALDDVTAALESVLAHFEGEMSPHDSAQRRLMCNAARAAISRATGGEGGEG